MRLIALLTLSTLVPSGATSESGHDLYHEYYQHWYNHRGVHCCDETHCRPAEFRLNNGRWEVLLRTGEWYAWKDSDLVVDDYGLNPFGSVCDTESGWVYCVDPPQAGI